MNKLRQASCHRVGIMITTITLMAATIYSQAIPNMSSTETTFLLLFNSKNTATIKQVKFKKNNPISIKHSHWLWKLVSSEKDKARAVRIDHTTNLLQTFPMFVHVCYTGFNLQVWSKADYHLVKLYNNCRLYIGHKWCQTCRQCTVHWPLPEPNSRFLLFNTGHFPINDEWLMPILKHSAWRLTCAAVNILVMDS